MGETGLEKVKTVLRVTSGNFLEMYDFFLFGYLRPADRARRSFPTTSAYASLMLTFLTFAAGFAHAAARRDRPRRLYRPHRPPRRA